MLAAEVAPITKTGATSSPAPSITITPGAATLSAGESLTFVPTFAGLANSAVTWSVSPAAGTISASGKYTPPPLRAFEYYGYRDRHQRDQSVDDRTRDA